MEESRRKAIDIGRPSRAVPVTPPGIRVRTTAVRLVKRVWFSGIDQSWVTQGLLFGKSERQRQTQLDEVSDLAKGRFGASALRRGSSLERDGHQKPESWKGGFPE